MRYLLDTHTFIWLDSTPERLSAKVAELCKDPDNILLLSMASVWEMQIKLQLSKLTLPAPLAETIKNQLTNNQIQLLPILLDHVLGLEKLPAHHKDPFDCLLIAQSLVEGISLVSDDPIIAKYSVQTIW